MVRSVFGASVQGASHKRNGSPCEDSYQIRDNRFRYNEPCPQDEYYSGMREDISIIAVADGHGSSACPLSAIGSRLAVKSFCDIIAELCYKYRDNMVDLAFMLRNEVDSVRVSQSIEREWKNKVQKNYYKHKKERQSLIVDESNDLNIYRLYGTTLLGMMISDDYIFEFQLGDGNITMVNQDTVCPALVQEKILGVETHSLSKRNAWKHALTDLIYVDDIKKFPLMFVVSTDGMINSYLTEEEYNKTCRDYFSMISEYGKEKIEENLPKWLDETSEQGCGDDTTAVFAYLYKNEK